MPLIVCYKKAHWTILSGYFIAILKFRHLKFNQV